MGGGQTGSQQTQTSQVTQLPPWINDAAQQNYAFAQNAALRPLQQFQGQMVPDIGPQLKQSWNTAASAGNAGVPQFNAATAGYTGALGQTPMSLATTNMDPYMSPYTKDVINTSLPLMEQELGKSLNTNAGTAAQTGAFGGSRFGVQQGTAQAQGALGMANMAAGLNQANFTQARAAEQADQAAQQAKINSDIAAASGLTNTGSALAQQANNAFTMQNTAGTQQMATAQDAINANMSKYNEAWNYPTKQLGVLQSALGMTPYGQSTTGAGSTSTYTPTDWAALAAAGIGAAGNVFMGKSDKRLKKNLKKVGKHVGTGVPIYDFNWKGQPPGAPKTRGPMAQDVRKVLPGAVAAHPATGVLHVDPGVLGALSRPGAVGPVGAMRGAAPVQMRTEHRRRIRPPQIRGALGG